MIITTDPRPDLRRRIDARLGQGEMLLAIATDETARNQVRLALQDLEEATAWLGRSSGSRPADLLLELAGWRLNAVQDMLRRHGAGGTIW